MLPPSGRNPLLPRQRSRKAADETASAPADGPFRSELKSTSNIVESKDDPTVSSAEAENLSPKDLWEEAYYMLRNDKDKKKLIEAYDAFLQNQRVLQDSVQPDSFGSKTSTKIPVIPIKGRERELQLEKLVDVKRQAVEEARLKIPIGEKKYIVKEKVDKIISAIIAAKEFITTAASLEPHAAFAWAGVSVLLPLLLNPAIQDIAAIDGLEYISDLLLRFRVMEITYREGNVYPHPISAQSESEVQRLGKVAFETKTVKLYSQILEYQIRLACQCSRRTLSRYFRDVVLADDWKAMLAEVKGFEQSIIKDLREIDGYTMKVIDNKISESLDLQIRLREKIESIEKNQRLAEQERYLDKLHCAEGAAFNSGRFEHERLCLPNTRTSILNLIYEWSADPRGKHIFWLRGMAGTGKSTIARTVARHFSEEGQLGASFFFSKGGGDLGNASKFVPTLAFQLSRYRPGIAERICKAIVDHPGLDQKRDLWKYFIIDPLSQIETSTSAPLVIIFVIDALDECDNQDDVRLILQLFAESKQAGNVKLRIFVTSRPEQPINLGFGSMDGSAHRDIALHSVFQDETERDISAFLKHELGLVSKERGLSPDWPKSKDLEKLVQKANGLFIYAATACRFIRDRNFRPKKQLSLLLKDNPSLNSHTAELDEMYMQVLRQSVLGGCQSYDQPMVLERFRKIVGCIVILFKPLCIRNLSLLLQTGEGDYDDDDDDEEEEEEEMKITLHPLGSVLDVSNLTEVAPQLLHPSFRDFLLNPKRCTDPQFWVNGKKAHTDLTNNCLKTMSKSLRKDICNLRLPGIHTNEVDRSKIEQCIPAELQYACSYWVYHFQESDLSPPLLETVYKFLKQYLLRWFEALSLLGKMQESIYMLSALLILVQTSPYKALVDLVYDAYRFSMTNRSTIEQAPLQAYCAALIFSPSKSKVRELFENQVPSWIKVKPLVPENWSSLLQTLEGHLGWVTSVAFSSDGQKIVSGSDDKTVRVWDAGSGSLLQTLEGHSDWVTSVAFSSDGQKIVSGSGDKTVRVWDAGSGSLLQTLEGHSDSVTSVAFSSDGQLQRLNADDRWITCCQKGVVLLPENRRVETLAVHSNRVVIGSRSGIVTILRLNLDNDCYIGL
ncbi:WD40 repeat-like protein [Lepidopterella palustris CBS 459.81]|uniref:WD40 repeat-like protein n=1 Tax=Lepidopterella palustris CBS 459.81 TaxID=1314670 RepID=A0A8E2EFH4_9PEZI|nr:WD40 repeat-like protein [Lepidopterella palustris CBS 459.81]